MARKKVEFHGKTYRDVLGFTARHWRRQPGRISFIFASIMVATLAAVLTPYYAGQLVNAVASGAADDPALLDAAIMAFMSLLGLGVVHVVLRFVAFRQTIALTLRMMGEISTRPSSRFSVSRPTGTPTPLPVRPCARSHVACGRWTC